MTNPIDMTIVECLYDLLEYYSSIFLIVIFVGYNSIKKFSSRTEFENEIYILLVLKIIDESEDVWVI